MPATNPYYQDQFSGQAGQTATAEQVKSEFQGVQSGFDGVQGDVNRAIKGQPGETLAALANASTRAGKWMKFDSSGNPLLVSSPLNPRGAWAPNTVYNVGDAFTAAPNSSLYYVNTGYTSGSSFGSVDTTNTQVIVNLASLYYTIPVAEVAGAGGLTVNAVAGNNYGCDSTSGNITINLPTAAVGDSPISLTYLAGAASTVTVNAATGQYINGNTQSSMVMDITGFMTTLQYWGPTYGWRVRTMG